MTQCVRALKCTHREDTYHFCLYIIDQRISVATLTSRYIEVQPFLFILFMGLDEMVGWHHRLNGYEFKRAFGVGDGQGSLACCSPWGHKESDMTELSN